MARALRSVQVTPADELRDLLAASEKLIANLRGNRAGALLLLENLDRLSELWPQLTAGGVDLRPEAGRWETLHATVRRYGRRLVAELRAQGGLAALRAEHHPDGQAEWWWRLDETIAAQNKRQAVRSGLVTAAILVTGAALYFLLRLLFPVDPNLQASMNWQTAGEQKIQQGGDFAGALADFRSAAEILPDNAENWLRLGAAQQKVGDKVGMAESYRRARALLPSDVEFNLTRGQVYLAFNRPQEAKSDIDAALMADPESAIGYYLLSSVYELLGQPGEAYNTLQRAADLAEAQQDAQLTAMARYRMAMLMQQVQAGQMISTPPPAP